MFEPLSINPQKSALLLMDFQEFILRNFLSEDRAMEAAHHAARLLAAARAAGMFVGHIMTTFRPGYPEISPRNKLFSQLKDTGTASPGSDATRSNATLTPVDMEPIVTKHRRGAFTGTDLERLLRTQNIETRILSGVTTSGVVLSTVRQAFDLDYALIVVCDGCADTDSEVHDVLLDKVISQHATIASTDTPNGLLLNLRESISRAFLALI